jgi:putative ABC transport system permease protein
LHSECVWLRLWVELPSAAQTERYRRFLAGYGAEQQRSGRFRWPPSPGLLNVRELLAFEQPVPPEIRLYGVVSFGFLLVCLVNAVGLLLAKFMSRSSDVGVRRALGATQIAIFTQCLIETGVIGLAGGLLGLGFCLLGLAGIRSLVSGPTVRFMYVDGGDILIALGLAVTATLLAGLYPTWRATRVQPAWQLKII